MIKFIFVLLAVLTFDLFAENREAAADEGEKEPAAIAGEESGAEGKTLPQDLPEAEKQPEAKPAAPENPEDDIFYFQPATAAGYGLLSGVRFNLNLDFYFTVKHTRRLNIYLGLGTGVYYAPIWGYFFEFPVYANLAFDFVTPRAKGLKSVGLKFDAGFLMLFLKGHDKSIFGMKIDNVYFPWFVVGIWTELLFQHDIVLRFGVENGELVIPTPAISVGYRF